MPRRNRIGARALATSALAAALIAAAVVPAAPIVAPTTVPTVAAADAATRVIAIARAQLGDPWRYGASGPSAFDCSGLVTYAFRQAGQLGRIGGGGYRSASSLFTYFSRRGLASRRGGRVGDLVIYGGGSHVGIYLGAGRVISTLLSGVRIHGVYGLYQPFTAFLHTGLSGRVSPSREMARRHIARSVARHRRHRRHVRPMVQAVTLRPVTHVIVASTWTGSSLGPTAAAAALGAAAFERELSDPTGMIAREVRREAGTWQDTVAAQDGVTDARLTGLMPGARLAAVRSVVASERTWLELRAPSGRRTWVASQRARR